MFQESIDLPIGTIFGFAVAAGCDFTGSFLLREEPDGQLGMTSQDISFQAISTA